MAEFTASIVAFLQLADSVIRVCSHIISASKDAPRDMIIISSEAKTAEALPNVFAAAGPIQACYGSIVALERLLPKIPNDPTKKSSFRMADLAWALKESQVLSEISFHKSTPLLALTGDVMREIQDIKVGVQRVEQALSSAERSEALNWLQSKCNNPSAIHNSTFRNHEEHTNAWLHKWSEWDAWLQPRPSKTLAPRFLWIHGIPGAGKSVMASFIEHVKTHCASSGPTLGYAYYYCHYSHGQDEGLPFLRWIVGHLSRQAEYAPQKLKQLRDSGCDPTIPEILTVLQAVLSRFDVAYVVIDGVDESEPRSQLLSVLATLATDERFKKIRLLATSRLSHDIEQTFSDISISLSMSNDYVKEDVRTVVMTGSLQILAWRGGRISGSHLQAG
ncbi:vegetative incompatibility protein het-e-1 [Podospora didyma]|uniref:Vegetative incompatibility protein het-e-1 n=1 Tax=Podospora didyma TaxID=330526 RepID=A0AAE0NZ90_9PEZI|nr:vegetative incompatibility protein het-e-1 [Podospora didyma]